MSVGDAKKCTEDYFGRYSSIRAFMDGVIELARRTGYAETILHRRRKIQDLNSKNANKRSQAQRFAVNTVIQGSAADLIKVAMVAIAGRIEREALPVELILQIHDELVFELPAEQAETHGRGIGKENASANKIYGPLKVVF